MAMLRRDGKDLCEVEFFNAVATGGKIKVIEGIGGPPLYTRTPAGPIECSFAAACTIPLGEVEIVGAKETVRVLVQSANWVDGVCFAFGILLGKVD